MIERVPYKLDKLVDYGRAAHQAWIDEYCRFDELIEGYNMEYNNTWSNKHRDQSTDVSKSRQVEKHCDVLQNTIRADFANRRLRCMRRMPRCSHGEDTWGLM